MEVNHLKNAQIHFSSLYDGADIIIDLDKICHKSLHRGAFLYFELNAQKTATYKKEKKVDFLAIVSQKVNFYIFTTVKLKIIYI